MRVGKLMKYYAALSSAVLFAFTAAEANDGGTSGGGGDGVAISFYSMAASLQRYLSSDTGLADFNSVRVNDYSRVVRSLIIETTDDTLRDSKGEIKDALNFPGTTPRVQVNRARWLQLRPTEQRQLAFHEILSLMGVESSNDYRFSSQLKDARAASFDSVSTNAIEETPSIILRVECSQKYEGTWVKYGGKEDGKASRDSSGSRFYPEKLIPGVQTVVGHHAMSLDESTKIIASLQAQANGVYRLSIYHTSFDDIRGYATSDQFLFSGTEAVRGDFKLSEDGKIIPVTKSLSFAFSVTKVKMLNKYGHISFPTGGLGSGGQYTYTCSITPSR